ncbi:MAG: Holliday junction resolvase RuvX [Actinomycetia bacterium]|nr:Holliday junction resolvase RuvX [Actinomycetes bacterium]
MAQGVRLGVDVGSVRIGVAGCDPDGILASPVETVPRGPGDLDRIAALTAERGAVEVVVGMPVSLSGGVGPAAARAQEFADRLAERLAPVPVRTVDERFTTVDATRALAAAGVRGPRRRAVVDQAAAVLILQQVLDSVRATGTLPGVVVQTSPTAEAPE